eukprot:CAMPEP_0183351112 /NCGR_PEP_ID=MMETSP0164_2-20130417/23368_1 /TAXON_ID=221442 /ORGANISM="Coccolithus pelagicus ssp braarudi, Strain PLY182g" /LENGTH=312 /DNA_ID=CAMNT_0025523215 /DNA_START=60 /DNA_END=998 /DNA_ORIENTATION=-
MTALAVALGGSSDIIGVLAFARARGFKKVVLVQPGSPESRSATGVKKQKVSRSQVPEKAPSANFYNNPSMLEALVGFDQDDMLSGYYLSQPKDDGKGFSASTLEMTSQVLQQIAADESCTEIIGLDFGGDVALPGSTEGAFIVERDLLNLRAAMAAAKKLKIPAAMVAVSPGCDAAAVAPAYESFRAQAGQTPLAFEMGPGGKLQLMDKPPPACTLRLLPQSLFSKRMVEVEAGFTLQLRGVVDQIMALATSEDIVQHSSKTYWIFDQIAREKERRGPDEPFFIMGTMRSAEGARAHLHSSFGTGVYELSEP